MFHRWFTNRLTAIMVAMLPGICAAQTPQQSGTLAVSGYSGQIPVLQMEGKSYVEIDALARLTAGSVGYPGNQMTLTIPPPDSAATPEKKGFSKDFLKTGIEAMSVIREWRAALQHAIENHYILTEEWLGNFRRAADNRLALATVAAATEDDKNGLILLTNELGFMQKLEDNYWGLYKSSTYIPPDSFDSNPLNRQVLQCARDLAAVATSGQYQDVSTCH